MVNKLFPITNIFFYVITILISYFLISENDISKMEQIIHFYNFYTKNKSAKLIKTILSIDPKNDCPENSFPFSFYEYPGTKQGCLISKKNLEEGSCGLFTKIFRNYENIEETDKKSFEVIFGKKLCAIPFNEKDYINNLVNVKGGKLCGKIDSIGNKLYVNTEEDCPINDIIINKVKKIDKYTTIEFIENELYLHFSNENVDEDKDYYLLTNESFKISEGLPCINPGKINTYHIQYLLSKANKSYICDTFINNERLDTRYKPLTLINKTNLYNDNGINLDEYYDYPFKGINLNLYQLGYIGIDKNFISNILDNSDRFISNINRILNYYEYNKYIILMIFSFLFLIIVNLIFKYFIVDITIYILTIIFLGFGLANLTLNIFIIFLLREFNSLSDYYSNKNNDKIFNGQLKYIDDIINESKNINLKNIIGISSILFLIIIFDFINCCLFNNPSCHLKKVKNDADYFLKNKKIYNSINVLKPFEDTKESKFNNKKEIELSKINAISDEDSDDNIINKKSDEEDILTNE